MTKKQNAIIDRKYIKLFPKKNKSALELADLAEKSLDLAEREFNMPLKVKEQANRHFKEFLKNS